MKKFLTAVAMALLLVGCAKETVDLSGINEKLAELDNRVSALEGAIASIQSAIGDGVFVQKVEQYADPETGKTIGVTVTYTSGKVVYFEISPKADYSGPVLGVIRSGSGALVWSVDGVAIKDAEGNEVPVNKTPVFTIDEEGYLWVSIDGGDPVKLGPVKSEGASLVDGIFKDIKVEQDKVVLVLSDDSIVNIPFAEAFKLVIEGTEFLNDGKAITIPYSVTAKTANTVVDVTGYDPTYFYVQVTDENIIITPLMSWVSTKMLVYADSKVGLTSMVSIEISPESARVIDPRVDGDIYANYVVESEGGTIEMHVVSNVEIEAKVLDECDWITIVSTKSKTYTITATVAENTGMARFGYVAIYKKGTDKQLQTIDIYQAKTSAVTNLSKNGTANSYIVTKPGDFKFKAVKGNSEESVGTVAKAEVLWETTNSDSAPEAKSIIAAAGIDEGFVTFSTPDNLVPGNAVIAAKDAEGKILWSWHIWIPGSEITTVKDETFYNSAVMDRNLGAIEVAPKDNPTRETYGLMYQWGRKDPFPGSIKTTVAEGVELKKEDAGTADLAYTIEHPTIWLKGEENTGKGNWNKDVITTLWNDESNNKTIYDPCPPGYRVPVRNSELAWFKSSSVDGWTTGTKAYAYGNLVFPLTGYLESDGPNSYSKEGARVIVWSANSKTGEESDKGYGAYLRSDKTPFYYSSGYFKYVSGVVRCVVDPNAPQPDPTVDLSEKGSANSYIVSAAGDYKFKAVKGNSKESVGTIAAVELVWETNNTATAPETANTIIAKVGVDDGYITFSTPATLAHGNALIAAKDAEGTILWSWLIWIPKTKVETADAGFAGEKALMDRNLGALVVTPTSENDVTAEGLYYQWGRPTPLLSKNKAAVPAIDYSANYTTTACADVATGIKTPLMFYHVEGKDWLAAADNTLWGATKTQYDPCPPGYKVPGYNAELNMWKKVSNDDFPTLWTYAESPSPYCQFKTGTLVFPLAGYINGSGQGLSGYGKRALVWSSVAASGDKASGMFIRENKYYSDGNHKASGASVRCVAE